MLIPRQSVPALQVQTLDHGLFTLGEEKPEHFTLLNFYRGLHCPLCAKQLIELARLLPEYESRGVVTIAISSDGEERTREMANKVNAPKGLMFGYGLSLASAREWGLYLSQGRGKTSIGIEEPELFSEPGVFLIQPDQTLYYGVVQTMPFARTHFDELLTAIDFSTQKNYPARGEYTGAI